MNDKEKKIMRYREENKTVRYGQTVFTGFVSRELLEAIDVCATDLRPSKIFINIGTNDLSDRSIPVSELMENYDRIISEIEARLPDTTVYLMAYYPVNTENLPCQ